MVEFSVRHFAVSGLVVEFQDFGEVFDVSDILVLLGLGENRKELVHLQLLLVTLLCSAQFLHELLGWGQVQRTENVAKVKRVYYVRSLKVVYRKRKLGAWTRRNRDSLFVARE